MAYSLYHTCAVDRCIAWLQVWWQYCVDLRHVGSKAAGEEQERHLTSTEAV